MNKTTSITKISCFLAVFVLSIISTWAQCTAPAAVTITEITSVSAKVQWNSSASADGYEIEIRTSGVGGSGSDGLVSTFTEPSNSTYTVSNLTPATNYIAYVRTKCVDGTKTPYTASETFTTSGLGQVLALVATEITGESFLARWATLPGATEYRVLYSQDPLVAVSPLIEYAGINLVKTIFDLDSEETYYYKVQARVGDGPWIADSNIILVETNVIEPTIAVWNGINWTAQPTAQKDVFINANFNTATDEFGFGLNTKDLRLASGNKFTVASGTGVLVYGSIINEADVTDFVVESNGNIKQQVPLGNTSVITNTGPITVVRNSFPIYRLDYTAWSSPVSNQSLVNFSPNTTANRFYQYTSSTASYTPIASTNVFVPGKGYLIRAPNNYTAYDTIAPTAGVSWEGKFQGIPNNGTITFNLEQKFNLVGNPYPTDMANSAFLNRNEDNIEGSMWFWRRRNNPNGGDTSSYYAVYSRLGGTNITPITDGGLEVPSTRPGLVSKVGQAFLVQTKSASTNPVLLFDESVKKEDNFENIFFKQQADQVEKHVFYLNMTAANGIFSQVLLGFAGDASDGVDRNDAVYIGDSPIALSSLIDNQAYTIQGKALPFDATQEFAMRFETSIAGSYNIALEDVTGMFIENVDPILVDMMTNTSTNLRNGSYSFATETGVFDTRFKVVFVETALGTVDNAINANAVAVINNNNVLSIDAGSYTINNIVIYDMLGRAIYKTSNVDSTTTSISDLRSQKQIILVQISTDHGVVTKKVQF